MKDILNSYTLSELRKMVSSTNMKKYSKLIKNDLIDFMIKSNKFNDVTMKDKAVKKEPTKKVAVKKVEPKVEPKVAVKKVEPKVAVKKVEVKKVEPKVEPKKDNLIDKKIDTIVQFIKNPSKRQYNNLEKLKFNMKIIDFVQNNVKLTDFYPTPEKCILAVKKYILGSENVIDLTAGIGAPIYYISKIVPKASLTAIEKNNETFELGKDILKDSNIKFKKGDVFDLKNNLLFDYYFLNPPFTSSYSAKDNYYIKFILKLGMILENSNIKKTTSQILMPTKFLNEAGIKIGTANTNTIAEILMKVPKKELQRYLDELKFFDKIDVDIKEQLKEAKEIDKSINIRDIYYEIFENVFYGETIYVDDCTFDFTKFKIANMILIQKKN